MRNRKFIKYKGPLIICEKTLRCFRNIPGIDICKISGLNILKLAPGGHVGRLCIWTDISFVKLNSLFTSYIENDINFNKKAVFQSSFFSEFTLPRIIKNQSIQDKIRNEYIICHSNLLL